MNELSHQIFWLTSRAAGIGALLLASASVGVGLLMGGRMVRGRGRAAELRVVHEALTLATLTGIAIHGAALLGDAYMHPSVADLTIPFLGPYRPVWTGLGILGGWILAVLGLSYYARTRIGAARWRKLHRFAAVGWLLGIVHSLGAGTDAGQLWFLGLLVIAAGPALLLLLVRMCRIPFQIGRPADPAAPTITRANFEQSPQLAPELGPVCPAVPELAGLLTDVHGGVLVLTADPSMLASDETTIREVAGGSEIAERDEVSLHLFMMRIARRLPTRTVLHAVVSPDLAAASLARMSGRAQWVLHVTESEHAWSELLDRAGIRPPSYA